jgi:hypothetical protein
VTGRWTLPALSEGELAPEFMAPTRDNPRFHFSTVAGRYVLLGFLPPGGPAREAALASLAVHRPRFNDVDLTVFLVVSDSDFEAAPPDLIPGLRVFLDPARDVFESYGVESGWFLLDPGLRVISRAPLDAAETLFNRLATLPAPGGHAGVPLVAPVLVVPRVFTPDLCRRLIAYYDAEGGKPSGVMRDINGRTVGLLDPMKNRRDVTVVAPELKGEIIGALQTCLLPMIARTYHFSATRLERYLIACYDAQEGGYFRPHRDNVSMGTAHRKFAVSINLNADEFEGGDLRFPEFGPRTYRPPTGGAVVFACGMLHEATPVTRGRRFAVLPFLYDEAGEEIRVRNRHLLDA